MEQLSQIVQEEGDNPSDPPEDNTGMWEQRCKERPKRLDKNFSLREEDHSTGDTVSYAIAEHKDASFSIVEKTSLLVLGMGNPILRDDSAGLVACARARRRLAPVADKAGVIFKELCIGGFDLLYEIEGFDHLIVIDAFHTADSVPGRVRTLSLEDLGAGDATTTSGHLLSLPRAIELSRRLGYRTPQLLAAVVIDVGTDGLEFGEELSPEVAGAIPVAMSTVCSMVEEMILRTSLAPGRQELQEMGL